MYNSTYPLSFYIHAPSKLDLYSGIRLGGYYALIFSHSNCFLSSIYSNLYKSFIFIPFLKPPTKYIGLKPLLLKVLLGAKKQKSSLGPGN